MDDDLKAKLRAAFADPEAVALMRKDPELAKFFDEQGNLLKDISGLYEDGGHRRGYRV